MNVGTYLTREAEKQLYNIKLNAKHVIPLAAGGALLLSDELKVLGENSHVVGELLPFAAITYSVAQLGSKLPSYLAKRLFGVDVGEYANAGGSTIAEVYGVKIAVPFIIYDLIIGAGPSLIGRFASNFEQMEYAIAGGIAAIAARIYPFYGIRGQGMTTAVGAVGAASEKAFVGFVASLLPKVADKIKIFRPLTQRIPYWNLLTDSAPLQVAGISATAPTAYLWGEPTSIVAASAAYAGLIIYNRTRGKAELKDEIKQNEATFNTFDRTRRILLRILFDRDVLDKAEWEKIKMEARKKRAKAIY